MDGLLHTTYSRALLPLLLITSMSLLLNVLISFITTHYFHIKQYIWHHYCIITTSLLLKYTLDVHYFSLLPLFPPFYCSPQLGDARSRRRLEHDGGAHAERATRNFKDPVARAPGAGGMCIPGGAALAVVHGARQRWGGSPCRPKGTSTRPSGDRQTVPHRSEALTHSLRQLVLPYTPKRTYLYVLVHTFGHLSVPVHTGMYWYVLPCENLPKVRSSTYTIRVHCSKRRYIPVRTGTSSHTPGV